MSRSVILFVFIKDSQDDLNAVKGKENIQTGNSRQKKLFADAGENNE